MNFIELSSENASRETKKLADIIRQQYAPDAVVFVAKGAYRMGLELGELFDVPVLEIFAERKHSRLKRLAAPILQILPKKLKALLRAMEINNGTHIKAPDRTVFWGKIPEKACDIGFKKILLVDDSCDTGNTFFQCIGKIRERFPDAEIKTAAINVFSDSKKNISTDFYIYTDYIISGPWSNDSPEHEAFISGYNEKFGK
ncbi:MAG: phosphoribosyltransferase [Oscillospiraceae bacterium]|nr:phosphoribosyltransferase [Oscillospiraceae bacterium]